MHRRIKCKCEISYVFELVMSSKLGPERIRIHALAISAIHLLHDCPVYINLAQVCAEFYIQSSL